MVPVFHHQGCSQWAIQSPVSLPVQSPPWLSSEGRSPPSAEHHPSHTWHSTGQGTRGHSVPEYFFHRTLQGTLHHPPTYNLAYKGGTGLVYIIFLSFLFFFWQFYLHYVHKKNAHNNALVETSNAVVFIEHFKQGRLTASFVFLCLRHAR